MVSAITTIVNPTGLHARPAAEFVTLANAFVSDVQVRKTSGSAFKNAKSIILLLAQGFSMGSEIEIQAVGEDEAEAIAALVDLIENKLTD